MKRIIPCLDVKSGQVVKGIKFKNHSVVGDIVELAASYSQQGADELVFYDISASADEQVVTEDWVSEVARVINIPFCVAGGIATMGDAEKILKAGADKISINSPALNRPALINELVQEFGQQCIVIGIDSKQIDNQYWVYQYTGCESRCRPSERLTIDWVKEVQDRGAGEIVLNCMNQDGVRQGYDLAQLQLIRALTTIPLIASGGAGKLEDFKAVFDIGIDGALAASIFHHKQITIPELKNYLISEFQIRPLGDGNDRQN